MPDFQIVETTVSDKLAALMPLIGEHRRELAAHPLLGAAPNQEAYRALENTGSLLALVAYANGDIAGYATAFIGPHLHDAGLRYAQSDALFVRPEHRKGMLGVRLMRELEQRARAKGARLMMWHAVPETALARLLSHLGYEMEEIVFSKEI